MLKKELEIAKELAAKAGDILLERYQENPSVSWKGIDAPVTAADRAASELLVRELKRLFPGDGILSEEEQDDPARLSRSRVWIIDPMDGTREFIDHLDEFAVMVGLAVNGLAGLGVVCKPTTGKIYYATTGSGAFLEERGARRRLLVSTEADPSRMTVAISRSRHSPQVDLICDRLFERDARGVSDFIVVVFFRRRDLDAVKNVCAARRPPGRHSGQSFVRQARRLTFHQNVPVFDSDFNKTGWLGHCGSYVFHSAFGAYSDRAIKHRRLLQEGVAHVITDLIAWRNLSQSWARSPCCLSGSPHFLAYSLLSSSVTSVVSKSQGLKSKKKIYPGPECVHVRTDFSEKGGLG